MNSNAGPGPCTRAFLGFRGLGFRVWVQGMGGGVQLPIACFFVGYQGVLTCYFAAIGATGMGLGI